MVYRMPLLVVAKELRADRVFVERETRGNNDGFGNCERSRASMRATGKHREEC